MGAVVKAAATADSVVGGTTTAAEAAGTVTLPGTVSGGGPSAAAISGSSEHVGGVTSAGGQQQSSSSSSTSVPQGRVKQLQSVADRLGCTLNQMMVAWAVRNQVGKQKKRFYPISPLKTFSLKTDLPELHHQRRHPGGVPGDPRRPGGEKQNN